MNFQFLFLKIISLYIYIYIYNFKKKISEKINQGINNKYVSSKSRLKLYTNCLTTLLNFKQKILVIREIR